MTLPAVDIRKVTHPRGQNLFDPLDFTITTVEIKKYLQESANDVSGQSVWGDENLPPYVGSRLIGVKQQSLQEPRMILFRHGRITRD